MSKLSPDDEILNREVARLSIKNAKAEHINYMGALSSLRASVLLTMNSLKLNPANLAWMYYGLGGDEEGGTLSTSRDLPVLCGLGEEKVEDGRVLKRPSLRFFQSELFNTPLGQEFLTTDVSVDGEGDSQYMLDTIWLPRTKPVGFTATTEAEKKSLEAAEGAEPHVPFFGIKDDGDVFMVGKFTGFTTPFQLTLELADETEVDTLPFGHYKVPTDARYALDTAIDLFREVEGIEPDYFGEVK
jgi:hypothetical protein